MSDQDVTRFTNEMAQNGASEDALDVLHPRIDPVAWYDFSRYEYLLAPEVLSQPDPADDFASATLEELVEDDTPTGDLTAFTTPLSAAINDKYTRLARWIRFKFPSVPYDSTIAIDLVESALDLSGELPRLLEVFWPLAPAARHTMIDETVSLLPPVGVGGPIGGSWSEQQEIAALGVHGDPSNWDQRLVLKWIEIAGLIKERYGNMAAAPEEQAGDATTTPPEHGHPFQLFDPGAPVANIGLRFVHRQEWRPLGTQLGDIIRTIPLGPLETQKVSTRFLRRTKVTRTSEQMKSVESSTETADTTKDTNEVVTESSKSFGWHAEAEAAGEFTWGSAKVSAGVQGESASKANESSSHLTESMQKTANRIRTESKIVVSTEGETQFEVTSSSEIRNPNDEIAVTFVYRKLQSQYAVFTSLVDVAPVVMVAERVPLPAQVTPYWVKRHDWIIAKALLDDSFRETLNSLSQTAGPGTAGPVAETKAVLDKSVASLGILASSGSASLSLRDIDITQEAQRAYQDAVRAELERGRLHALRMTQEERLLQHIRDNILHYCRAIWSQEDKDQRILRYRRLGIGVPTSFEFEAAGGGVSLSDLLQSLEQTGDTPPEIFGHFVVSDPAGFLPLTDVIEPSAPIGFVGNYAVFRIRRECLRNDTFPPLHILLAPYFDATSEDPLPGDAGPQVVDPAFLALQRQLADADVTEAVSKLETRLEMADIVPELRLRYEVARDAEGRGDVGAVQAFLNDDGLFAKCYPEYVFRATRTQEIVLDTNNVMVDVLPGRVSIMEAFKRAHRLIDVKRAELELLRRQKLIDAGQYGDPEIEKVTVLTGDGLNGMVNVAGLGDRPDEV